MKTQEMKCEGACDLFGGCHGGVNTVIVSRMGEMNLCGAAGAAYEAGGFVVSPIYLVSGKHEHKWQEITAFGADRKKFLCALTGDVKYEEFFVSQREDADEDVMRQLGHYLKEDVC